MWLNNLNIQLIHNVIKVPSSSFFLFFHSQSVASYSCAYHLMFINSCCGSEHHNRNRRFWQCVSFISEGNSFQKISPFVLATTDHVTTFSCRRDLGREYLSKGHGIAMISKDSLNSFRTKFKSVPKFRGSVSQEKTRE